MEDNLFVDVASLQVFFDNFAFFEWRTAMKLFI